MKLEIKNLMQRETFNFGEQKVLNIWINEIIKVELRSW